MNKAKFIFSFGAVFLLIAVTVGTFLSPLKVSATGAPAVITYQGRLADQNGDLLGTPSGTAYHFKFSLWTTSVINTGSKVWPSVAPTAFTSTVKQGLFTVNIGDTANGYPDILDYNFSNPNIYLQVEVSTDGVIYETLAPRQRMASAPFAQVASVAATVNGAGDSVLGNATSTNFFSTTASSTNLFFTNGFGNLTGNLTGNVTGSVSGNAGTVTNGVYTNTFGGLFDTALAATTTLNNLAVLKGVTDLIATRATTTNATTTNLNVSGFFTGAGLNTNCNSSSDKVIWSNGRFGCGLDAGGLGGTGITAFGISGAWQTGATQTLATTTDDNITLSIVSNSDTHTFTPGWIGQLAVARGGTGLASVTNNALLIGGPGNTVTQISTSSLGLLTTNVAEGTRLYYTQARFDTALAATTTLNNLAVLKGVTDLIATRATTTNATTTAFAISGIGSKLLKTDANGSVIGAVAGQDYQAAGSYLTAAVTGIKAEFSPTQTGVTQTFATSSDTNIGLVITSSGDTHLFTPTWIGMLAPGRGGTGISNPSAAGILLGSYAGGSYQQLATSSLGLLTTNVAEGSNKYYTDDRVLTYLDTFDKGYFFSTESADLYVNASTTIPKTYSNNTFTGVQTFNSTIIGSISGNAGTVTNGVYTTSFGGLFDTALAGTTTLNNLTTLRGLTDLITTRATSTSATSTSLFATTGVVTNLFSNTAHLTESGNLFYTDTRVNDFIHASTTIPKTYTDNTFSGSNTFSQAITGSVSGNAGTVTNGVYTNTFGGLFDTALAATTTLNNLAVLKGVTDLIATRATTTNATTTSIFGTTGVFTNLAATNPISGSITGSAASVAASALTGNTLAAGVTASSLTSLGALVNILTTGSSTLQNFTFVNATGTSATTTNLFATNGTFSSICLTSDTCRTTWPTTSGGSGSATWATTTSLVVGQYINYSLNDTDIIAIGGNATTSAPFYFDPNTTFAKIGGRMLVTGSTTLQNFTFTTATGSSATTTNFFATTASTTNLSFTNGFGNLTGNLTGNISGSAPAGSLTGTTLAANVVTSSLTSVGALTNILTTGSSTLQNFTFTNATGSQATTTNIFSTNIFGTTGNLTNLTVSNPISGSVTGSAGSVAASALTGNTLAAGVTASSLISLGILTGFQSNATSTIGGGTTASGLTIFGGATTTGQSLHLASTTMQNFTALQSTSTNATTTNFFSTTASSTNLFFTSGIGNLTGNLTGNISGSAPAGSLTGNTLASGVTASSLTSVGALVNILTTGSSTLQNFTFVNATGSQATTTNIFSTNIFGTTGNLTNLTVANAINGSVTGSAGSVAASALTGNTLASGVTASSLTSVGALTNLLVVGSSTLQAFTFTTATGTSATTTNFFSTTASSTNLFSTAFTTGAITANTLTITNVLHTGSTTLQNFTGLLSTTTNATSTNFFATTASTTNLSFTSGTGNLTGNLTGNISGSAPAGSLTGNTLAAGVTTSSLTSVGALVNILTTGSSTLQNFTFTNATGSQATTTNLFSTNLFGTTGNLTNLTVSNPISGSVTGSAGSVAASALTGNTLASGVTASSLTSLGALANLLTVGSSTLQSFTFVNATGTSATTTNFFSTTASSTNLFATALTAGLITVNNALHTSSTTLQNFTGLLSTTSNATTTNLFATTASSTNLFATALTAGLVTINNALHTGSTTLQNFTGLLSTTTNATTTSLFSTTASSTNLFFTSGTGNLTGNLTGNISGSAPAGSLTGNTLAAGVTASSLTNLGALVNILTTGSSTLQSFTFVNATGTSATTTNFFSSTASSTNAFSTILTTGSITAGQLTVGNALYTGSTTLQNFTGLLSTTSNATTTNFFATTASTTNLFFTSGTGNLTGNLTGNISGSAPAGSLTGNTLASGVTASSLTSVGALTNLLTVGSSTLQAFTFTIATGTSATTTNLFATTASTTNFYGGGLFTCNAASKALTYDGLGKFGCATITASATAGGSSGNLQFNNAGSIDGNDGLFYDFAARRLGIGTTTPRYLLQLASSTAPQLALSDASLTSNHWTFRNAGGVLYIATSSPTTFATSSAAVLTFTANANVGIANRLGIGTTTPSAAIDIDGALINPDIVLRSGAFSTTFAMLGQSETDLFLRDDTGAVTNAINMNFNGENEYSSGKAETLGTNDSARHVFYVSNSEVGGFDFRGYFSIGAKTTAGTALAPLDVTGSAIISHRLNIGSTATSVNSLLGLYATSTDANIITASSTTGFAGNFFQLKNAAGTELLRINSSGALQSTASTTLQAFTFTTATGTSATTTNFFSTTASSTNLFSTAFTTGAITANTLTITNVLHTGSTTLQAFTFTTATGTSATTTNLFVSALASTTALNSNSAVIGNLTVGSCSGCSSGGGGNSKFATSTNGFAISPNGGAGIALVIGGSATTTTGAELEVLGDLFLSGSTTMQRFTFVTATGTAATTTNFFSTTASSSSLFAGLLTAGSNALIVDSVGTTTVKTLSFDDTGGNGLNWTIRENATNDLEITYKSIRRSVLINSGAGGLLGIGTTTMIGQVSLEVASATPSIDIMDNDGILNQKHLLLRYDSGTFSIATGQDDFSASTTLFTIIGSTGLATVGTMVHTGSTTLQNFTFVNATGTSATTTNFFSTTASSTNFFAQNGRFGTALHTGSTTLQNFTFLNATGTNSTTTGSVTFSGLSATSTTGMSVCWSNAAGTVGRLTHSISPNIDCGVSASSRRYKQDIFSLSDVSGLAEIEALRPVSYKYTPEYLGTSVNDPNINGELVGFIAEEVQQIDPRLITVDLDGIPNGVQYDHISALLTKAIQQQQVEIQQNTSVLNTQSAASLTSLQGLQSNIATLNQNISAMSSLINNRFDFSQSSTTVTNQGLTVHGRAVLDGGLLVSTLGEANINIDMLGDITFFGRPYFTGDTAGSAVVKKGAKIVNITFDRDYIETPIVSATIALESASSSAELEEIIFSSDLRYIVTRKDSHGFSILLNKPAPDDISFSWIALPTKSQKLFTSRNEDVVALPIETVEAVIPSSSVVDLSATTTDTTIEATTTDQSPSASSPSESVPEIVTEEAVPSPQESVEIAPATTTP